MPSTVEDFWRMVTEHNICTMVQLNAPTQTATDRGYFYWAESDAPGSQITYGMKLELQKISRIFFNVYQILNVRILKIGFFD